MQLTLNIKNNNTVEKLMWLLDHFSSDEIEVVQKDSNANTIIKSEYSDEYIKQNWKELVSKGLSSYSEEYYKSEQYKVERGEYLMEKYK